LNIFGWVIQFSVIPIYPEFSGIEIQRLIGESFNFLAIFQDPPSVTTWSSDSSQTWLGTFSDYDTAIEVEAPVAEHAPIIDQPIIAQQNAGFVANFFANLFC
jgi:hypothetical protein